MTASPLKSRIQDDMKAAMKGGDKARLAIIRLLLLPRCNASGSFGRTYQRYWGTSEASRAGDRQHAAYVVEMGREPTRFTEGLAKAQWEYGIQGTPYWTKAARQSVIALSSDRVTVAA